uniref:Coenzyme Q-binding protein COQ10 START domain-containing protein n=1 Tax=Odontella aurita TaxID=265563 RepID=A0A7S4JA94_9STRA|mmetsp:Transcript_42454/g.128825  ORF Transcript_42454/g.128825 Transcript_42454/m.128825 type:complete len:155 (+) Transcript_42454:145-609(+)
MHSPNQFIKHVTDINAPIDVIWKHLLNIDSWKEWNRWTRLEAKDATPGTRGKLKASYEGDDEWKTFDFAFGEIDHSSHSLTWFGRVGGGCVFSGDHTMRLEPLDAGGSNWTRLIHTERFGGILPALGLGLPYETLDRNYLCMNESLKEFVEKGS